jgi:primosomal protein N' (replication factor Y)
VKAVLVAQVIVDVRVRGLNRVFDYSVPPDLAERLELGHRVLVPFGHRDVEGYVLRYPATSAVTELKPIRKLLDQKPLLTPVRLRLAEWLSEQYLCLLVQALQCWLPPGASLRASTRAVPLYEDVYRLDPALVDLQEATSLLSRAPRQLEAFRFLLAQDGSVTRHATREAGISPNAMNALVSKGLVERVRVRESRDPWRGRSWEKREHRLTAAQSAVAARLDQALMQGKGQFLLFGVTGSGKTHVYLSAISTALKLGKSAIVLVPEISLTPQAVSIYKGWFGDRVAVLHSRLSTSERADQWRAAARGDVQVVLGARSAVFAPLANLGIIVIDEEQEGAYKQEETPRYHAREVALARVQQEGGVLLLGSATPSLETFAAASRGELELLRLPHRVHSRPLPVVSIVDMREELLAGNRLMFSRRLQMEMHACLAKQEQAILFLNRRGYASFVLCRECGVTMKCNHCDVTLTYHEPARLTCHYCGLVKKLPPCCPGCGSQYLRPFGAGTQRVEQEVRRLFPRARVLRMDVDTTSRKGAHEALWKAFVKGEADILVGTQMVAKGLDFPGVTLVGVISADTSLHFPDFRAAERTFQLLTQVAGRAGRGSELGRVVVQTYTPDHYGIVAAEQHDYEAFSAQEIGFRRRAQYPPFTSLVRLLVTSDQENDAADTARLLARTCTCSGVTVVGPAPAPLSRLKDRFRWHILLKGEKANVLAVARNALATVPDGSSHVVADVDPLSLL